MTYNLKSYQLTQYRMIIGRSTENKTAIIFLVLMLLTLAQAQVTWKRGNHDNNCYTQGLSFINQTHLLQSCGLYGKSYFQIHQYDPVTNTLATNYKSQTFANKYFLEGSIYYPSNQIYYILTWQQHTVFRYRYNKELSKFQQLPKLPWFSEGWGMTHNNTHIFISDGSNRIYVVDSDLKIQQTLSIFKRGSPLHNINELEWNEQNGKQYIYANVYLKSLVVKISISESKVVQNLDLSPLKDNELLRGSLRDDEVLNGIAIDRNTMLVTGKDWRSFFVSQFRSSP